MAEAPDFPPGLAVVRGRAQRLRERLARPEIVVAPGCFDCLTARLVEQAGFPALYVTGSGVSMSQLGVPDLGVISFSEVLDRVRRIADVTALPVIADADTGYGGPLNVMRTVREFERAGVAAIQLEDQAWPKKCGHEPGRRLVPVGEMQARLRAACDARSEATLIVARTDARAEEGLAAALDRAAAYVEAGADVLFVEAPESEAELAEVGGRFGVPLLANMVEGGRTPILPAERLQALGFRLAIYPNALTRLFGRMGAALLAELKRTGTTAGYADRMLDHRGLWDLFDNPRWRALEDRYGAPTGRRLRDLARVVRSKNAGPGTLTLDLMFPDEATYRLAAQSPALSAGAVAARYGVPAEAVTVLPYPAGRAVKIVMDRPIVSGDPGDRDVYGAQQHAHLLDIEL